MEPLPLPAPRAVPSVYWEVWMPLTPPDGVWKWRAQVWSHGSHRGPAFTCYRLEELIRFVQTHYHPHPVCICAMVGPDVAEATARRLMAAGIVVFSHVDKMPF